MPRYAGLMVSIGAALAACDRGSEPTSTAGSGSGATASATPAAKSGGGISADLAKKLDTAGSGSDTPERTASSAVGEPAAGGSASAEPPKAAGGAAGPNPGSAAGTTADAAGAAPTKSTATAAQLKAVGIQLLPNWERDIEGPGTLSFDVKVPGNADLLATFTFQYGIEDPAAPTDRDAYKKWLAANKIFSSKDDRQKGAAWYLEGLDAAGKPAFRMVVLYGGKRLWCGGSLYKESTLAETRDHAVIQAKQICETLSL